MQKQIGYEGRQLIGFFKGTAGEFNKLGSLAPHLMSLAANVRNHVSPLREIDCGGCQGKGYVLVANGADDFEKERCGGCNGTGRIVANNI